jgi:N6-L-threonylcarbamoyladenine synthase
MKILSIETSCDDTGIAILEVSKTGNFTVLANIIASQVEIGKKYGGVYPMMAKREHQNNLVPVLTNALKQAKLLKSQIPSSKSQQNHKFQIIKNILEREPELFKKIIPFLKKYKNPNACPELSRRIDFISVTNGPGLEPCLWVGINFAKCLSYFWNIPVVPVNHIESHILVNLLENPSTGASTELSRMSSGQVKFPAIALVVSGGHTQIILVKKPFDFAQGRLANYEILGETRDDAAGECFDKCAKILGLGYPGGPIISKLASKLVGRRTSHQLPRPMINTKDYDFSFSGLKTAVLYANRKVKTKNIKYKREMSAEVQQAIIDVLIKKTMKAVKDFNAKSLILGGGVSANQELRKQFLQTSGVCKIIFPRPDLSTDNGLMTAIAGYYHRKEKIDWQKIKADGNLRISK